MCVVQRQQEQDDTLFKDGDVPQKLDPIGRHIQRPRACWLALTLVKY